jgi:diguanylate cyclase (GGDEF)-like protein
MEKGKKEIKINENNERLWIAVFVIFMAMLIAWFLYSSRASSLEDAEDYLLNQLTISQNELDIFMERVRLSGMTAAEILGKKRYSRANWDSTAQTICDFTGAYRTAIVNEDGFGSDNNGFTVAFSTVTKDIEEGEEAEEIYYTYQPPRKEGADGSIVARIPMYYNEQAHGMIYIYISMKELIATINKIGGDGSCAYFILDKEGQYIGRVGSDSYFGDADNFFEEMAETESLDSFQEVESLTDELYNNNTSFAVRVKADGEKKVVCAKPLAENWYLVSVMDHSYVDDFVSEQSKSLWSLLLYLSGLMIIFILSIAYILSKNRESAKEWEDKAETDLLTGLQNKVSTENKIKEHLLTQPGQQGMFVLFDIDNFKNINDTRGHAFGDEVLQMVGSRMRQEFRSSDILGRTGGDEFTIYLKDIRDSRSIEDKLQRIEHIFENFTLGDYTKYSVTASIGVCIYPKDGEDYESLYKAADHALYEAKRRGKNQIVVYEQ